MKKKAHWEQYEKWVWKCFFWSFFW